MIPNSSDTEIIIYRTYQITNSSFKDLFKYELTGYITFNYLHMEDSDLAKALRLGGAVLSQGAGRIRVIGKVVI